MTSPESAIVDFYPAEFEQDLNGKQQDWEAVVLIPFIDQGHHFILEIENKKDLEKSLKSKMFNL